MSDEKQLANWRSAYGPELADNIAQACSYGKLRHPNEAVGFIIAGRTLELPNHAQDPSTGFKVSITDLINRIAKWPQEITDAEWEEAIIWHTHPAGGVGPSRIDMANKLEGLKKHLVISFHEERYILSWY